MKLQIQTLIGTIIASSTLTIRIGDDLKHEAPGVADYFGLDLIAAVMA